MQFLEDAVQTVVFGVNCLVLGISFLASRLNVTVGIPQSGQTRIYIAHLDQTIPRVKFRSGSRLSDIQSDYHSLYTKQSSLIDKYVLFSVFTVKMEKKGLHSAGRT